MAKTKDKKRDSGPPPEDTTSQTAGTGQGKNHKLVTFDVVVGKQEYFYR